MSFEINSLNAGQRDAVVSLDGPVLILAGAGTGKTRTVTCRISYMIHQGIQPENILAVTFTNKSAVEMRERVIEMVGKFHGEKMTICTFHSLCVRILREGIGRLGYKKNFSIYTGGDQTGLIRQLLIKKGGAKEKLKPAEVISIISKAKNNPLGIASIADDFIAEIAQAYAEELRAQNAVDFDDLLILAERLLSEHQDVRDLIRERFKYVTVDEFQDTNSMQMRLLQLLVGAPYNICVVGDDDQSIYGWRGADSANILEFERFFPNPKIILLEMNYRSTEAVISTANSLIIKNVGRREKQLKHTINGGEKIRLIAMPGDVEEAEFICDEIHEINHKEKLPWENFAILFRTNMQSRSIEDALRTLKIPYRMVGAQSFYDRKEVQDLMAYLMLINNFDADVPLLRILNAPPRGIGNKTAMLLTDHSRDKESSVWQAMEDEEMLSQLGKKTTGSIREFLELIKLYKERFTTTGENMGEVFWEFLKAIDFHEWVNRSCKNDNEKIQRAESIHNVVDGLKDASDRGKTLQKFLDAAALQDNKDDDIESQKGVCLITLHASKGLEFPQVYLIGLEQEILPHKRSIAERTIDEERRLLYVGITRAKKKLTLSYCAFRTKYRERTSCDPSVFIEELDDTFIDKLDYEDIMGAESTDEQMDDFFDNMRELLKDE
ncbi:UvrD-helicase domain-containing protein [Akkermansiaceae bacterium]|nr:UvrD-helicase domain-containing protein [Akkermansiaceae bacterium]